MTSRPRARIAILLMLIAGAPSLIGAMPNPARSGGALAPPDVDAARAHDTIDPFFAALEQRAVSSACSSAGRQALVDGATQCVCQTGYAGRSCETCAVGYDRDAAGKCVLGATARHAVCFDKGTPYLDKYGDIACRCDTGFSGADCGGPDIVIDGATRSVEAGQQLRLRARGGSGAYTWELLSQRGVLLGVDPRGAERMYLAPSDVPQVEIVRLRIRDVAARSRHHDVNITVTPPRSLAVTGVPVGELVSFDQAMLDYMKGRGIRAGVLAVAKDGHLVLSRGYGYIDKGVDADPFVHDEGGVGYVAPSTPMRLASITKPFTAAAVREALREVMGVEEFDEDDFEPFLDEPALPWIESSLGEAITSLAEQWFPFTPDGAPYYVEADVNNAYECPAWQSNSMPDSRWDDITIKHLLGHRGGFDRSLSPSPRWSGDFAPPPALGDSSYLATTGDPNFKPALMMYDLENATGLDFTGPLRPKALVQYMAGICLAFSPGAREEYSNFGYTLLGRVLEGLRGETWSPGSGVNRRYGWGPYIDLIEDFLADHGISGIRAGGTGSFSAENPDYITTEEPYYRYLNDDGSETSYLNVGDAFGVAPNGDMFFGPPGGVPAAYGAFSMQTMESHGGLVASAPGLIKFMRHFRLAPGDYGDIGSRREDPSVGGASHGGLLPGTYTLAWQMSAGDATFTVPFLAGAWDQTSGSNVVISSLTSCTLPTGIDVVALFSQSQDPKDHDLSEYNKLKQFLGKAACQVNTWPGLLPLPEKAAP